jgi:hypothetical protein
MIWFAPTHPLRDGRSAKNKTGYSRIPMKFSLDYCEHRASHAGLGASDSLIIPNGRIMDKNCLRPVCPSSATNPVFERNVGE